MLSVERLLSIDKNNMAEESKTIHSDDLSRLVEWLSEKDDTIRYQSFLLLQNRSNHTDDVYPFWNSFCEKLKSGNSYQRSIGLMLIADNAKWDKDNRLDDVLDEYLLLLNDEKPITVRQCIQSLCKIVPFKNHLHRKIADKLMSVDLADIKETMRKLILTDILGVLAMIRKYKTSDEIESYIFSSLQVVCLTKKQRSKLNRYCDQRLVFCIILKKSTQYGLDRKYLQPADYLH